MGMEILVAVQIALTFRVFASAEPGCLVSQRQERFAFGTAKAASRMLPQEKDDKGEYQAKADCKGKGNYGHNIGLFSKNARQSNCCFRTN
jgi:hypothetical protein